MKRAWRRGCVMVVLGVFVLVLAPLTAVEAGEATDTYVGTYGQYWGTISFPDAAEPDTAFEVSVVATTDYGFVQYRLYRDAEWS